MGIKNEYIDRMTDVMMRMNPNGSKEKIRSFVESKYKEKLKNVPVYLDNNVTGENGETKLTGICKFIREENPVVSGNATFYMQPSVLRSPTSNMLRYLKKERKAIKKKMFNYEPTSYEYKRLDLSQRNLKVIMNAEYGGSGTKTSAFYTKYSPAATTLMAQSIITTMAALFESYIGDRQIFFHINECVDWMEQVISQCKDKKFHKWIHIPTKEEVIQRIRKHFYQFNREDERTLEMYISHCSDKEYTFLYYANNMKEFISNHMQVRSRISKILTTLPNYEASEKEVPKEFQKEFHKVNAYNKWVADQIFMNPYNVPEGIQEDMIYLRDIIYDYCFVEYLTPDSIERLNNHKRNTVLLVDTDSNVINSNIFVTFVLDELFPEESFGRRRLYNDMICVNMLAFIIDKPVKAILDYYGRCRNMDEVSRAELTMKNEFLFRILFLMDKKKRYAASIALREGNVMIPFKLEIKGMDFIKAGITSTVKERFEEILRKNILYTDKIDLHGMMRDLRIFEKDIFKDLRKGNPAYLKMSGYKSEDAYKKKVDKHGKMSSIAWQLPVFRGVCVWNELYPDDKIYSLDRVYMIKSVVQKDTDLQILLSTHPEMYDRIKETIFKNPDPRIREGGLKVICIPQSMDVIPDWIVPIIDYDITISDIMASFGSIIHTLNIDKIKINTPNGKAEIISSLIAI